METIYFMCNSYICKTNGVDVYYHCDVGWLHDASNGPKEYKQFIEGEQITKADVFLELL